MEEKWKFWINSIKSIYWDRDLCDNIKYIYIYVFDWGLYINEICFVYMLLKKFIIFYIGV